MTCSPSSFMCREQEEVSGLGKLGIKIPIFVLPRFRHLGELVCVCLQLMRWSAEEALQFPQVFGDHGNWVLAQALPDSESFSCVPNWGGGGAKTTFVLLVASKCSPPRALMCSAGVLPCKATSLKKKKSRPDPDYFNLCSASSWQPAIEHLQVCIGESLPNGRDWCHWVLIAVSR